MVGIICRRELTRFVLCVFVRVRVRVRVRVNVCMCMGVYTCVCGFVNNCVATVALP